MISQESSCLEARKIEGFSLVEIVMALGIIAFAIVGIMGLFPVAMRAARESQQETRSTYIARQIISDLETLPASNTFIATTTDILNPGLTVDLSKDATEDVAFNSEGLPTTIPGDIVYRAKVSIKANVPATGLSQVEIAVRPVTVATNLPPYTFTTVLPL